MRNRRSDKACEGGPAVVVRQYIRRLTERNAVRTDDFGSAIDGL